MKLYEAKSKLMSNGYRLMKNKKYHTDDEITLKPTDDYTICPNCGESVEINDNDFEDEYIFIYCTCPKCDTMYRVDCKLIPEFITIK